MKSIGAIVIGASAGALEALTVILTPLPANYPVPIIVVVHLPPDYKSIIAELFEAKCRIRVKEVEPSEQIEKGTIYFAPPNYHVLVESSRRLSLSTDEPVNFSRPSIDVLFESAADAFGPDLVGIVLTGANDDGAAGLGRICEAGGTAWVQTPATAFAPAMPTAALVACPSAQSVSLDRISELLLQLNLTEQI